MHRADRAPITNLMKPMYVMQMGWPRFGLAARRAWLRRLREACQKTLHEIDDLDRTYANEERRRAESRVGAE